MDNIEFDFFKNPSKSGTMEDNNSYHIRINRQQTIDLKELVKRIQTKCSMTPSDVHGVLTALKDEISYGLAHGQNVNIDGLCRFRIILGSKDSGNCTGKENAKEIGFKKIRITPYKEFSEETKKKLIPLTRSHAKHSSELQEEEITKLLYEYLKNNKTITRRKFEELCNITRYKASSYITDMIKKGVIKNIGYKTHPVYTLDENNI